MDRNVMMTSFAAYGGLMVGANGMRLLECFANPSESAPLWLHSCGLVAAIFLIIYVLAHVKKGGVAQSRGSSGS